MNSTTLSLTMSVDGGIAYVLLPNPPGSTVAASIPTLTATALRAEAAAPSVLLPFMEAPVDPTHHGTVSVATPFVRTNTPVTLRNGTTYTLLMAGEPLADSAVPCCLQQALETVAVFQLDPGDCGEVACCECASPALPELRPDMSFVGGLGLPVSPAAAQEVSCDAVAFTQTFALIGGSGGSSGNQMAFTAGGSALRVAQTAGAAELRLPVVPLRRAVASVRAVQQRATYYVEDESAVGAQEQGRRMFFRCASGTLFYMTRQSRTLPGMGHFDPDF